MRPFLRPTDRGPLAPVGWISEPAGSWAGREVDVVYNPRRHDVLLVRHDPREIARRGFRESGFRRVAVDGQNEMWVRDRLALVARHRDQADRSFGQGQSAQALGRSL